MISAGDPVSDSAELQRILNLPRRPPPVTDTDLAPLVQKMTALLRRERTTSCICASMGEKCITELLPVQAAYLYEAMTVGGVLGIVQVGGGKCLAAGSEIFDAARGTRVDISRAGEGMTVPSMQGGAIGLASATGFPSGEKPCWRLLLADGSRVDASFDHPIFTHRGWVHTSQILPDDLVAVASRVPGPVNPTKASDAEVKLLAYLLSDGGLSGSMARFTNATPAIIEEFVQVATEVCGGVSEGISRTAAREFSVLDSIAFRERWDLYGLAKHKRAHADIWGLSDAHVALFLNRFWACDGYVSVKELEITLASEKLIDDLRFLLSRLGIRSQKRPKTATCNGAQFQAWKLTVTGASALSFLDRVGPVLGKEDACARLHASLSSKRRNANRDIVPVGFPEFDTICEELGFPGVSGTGLDRSGCGRSRARTFLQPTRGQFISRQRFSEFCKVFGYKGQFSKYVIDGVAWERVASLTPVGSLPVYDLAVPEGHNFVANGIVVHNTGIDILTAMVVPGCKVAALLLPPSLVPQLKHDYKLWSQHFRVPNMAGGVEGVPFVADGRPVLELIPYSKLSHTSCAVTLKQLQPDVMIWDECHNVRKPASGRPSVRSRRVMEFRRAFPKTRFFVHSGTVTQKSIHDYVLHAAFALKAGCPLPLDKHVLEEWAGALDAPAAFQEQREPGALMRLCRPGETVRQGFRRRLVETPGIIATDENSLGVSLTYLERKPGHLPEVIRSAIAGVQATNCRPDGEPFHADPLRKADCLRQLAAGFYYRWKFPRGEPREVIDYWFDCRKAYAKELGERLNRPSDGMDSPLLCWVAAARWFDGYSWTDKAGNHHQEPPRSRKGPHPVWASDTFEEWRRVKDSVKPETETMWLHDYLAEDAAKWAAEDVGIVWYDHEAFGRRVQELTGLHRFEGGPKFDEALLLEKGDKSILCSIESHGTGKKLHRFSRNLVANMPKKCPWEQLIGRTHRVGQEADEVFVYVYRHTESYADAFDKAYERSKYVDETQAKGLGTSQKMLYGRLGW